MDAFMEKIVGKKKTIKDTLIVVGVIFAVPVAFFVLANIPYVGNFVASFSLLVLAALIYGAYIFIKSREIEYEYIVTNGDIDIDRIIARRKRKRILSASGKAFDILARYRGDHYTPEMDNIKNRIEAVTSMEENDIYFFTLNYKAERTIVFFQPEERMLDSFKRFNPRRVFKEDMSIQ